MAGAHWPNLLNSPRTFKATPPGALSPPPPLPPPPPTLPPPPGSAVTSCSCFPVAPLRSTFDNQPPAAERPVGGSERRKWSWSRRRRAGCRGGCGLPVPVSAVLSSPLGCCVRVRVSASPAASGGPPISIPQPFAQPPRRLGAPRRHLRGTGVRVSVPGAQPGNGTRGGDAAGVQL
uniref:vasodilator-stimulated phosphoprotein-like n=1 Tax=Arvicanthis niloticus TaxID=61156 RepID=UPI001486B690|nr:vasodilator-stimulated phosphoprotein-like [Arvicanthis niloticus]